MNEIDDLLLLLNTGIDHRIQLTLAQILSIRWGGRIRDFLKLLIEFILIALSQQECEGNKWIGVAPVRG